MAPKNSSSSAEVRAAGDADARFERTVKRLLATPPTPREEMPKKRPRAESQRQGKKARVAK